MFFQRPKLMFLAMATAFVAISPLNSWAQSPKGSECAEVYRQRATGEDHGGIRQWLSDHFYSIAHGSAIPADLDYLGPAGAPVTAFVDFVEIFESRHEMTEERALDRKEQLKMMSRILYQNSTGERYDAWQDFFRDVRHDMPGLTKAELESRLENAVAKLDDPRNGQVCTLKMKNGVPVIRKGKPIINVMTYFQFKRRIEGMLNQTSGSPVTIGENSPVTHQMTLPSATTGEEDSLAGFTTRGSAGEGSQNLTTQAPDLTISSGPSKKQALEGDQGATAPLSPGDAAQRQN